MKHMPTDISRLCLSFIQDSHPTTIAREYWTKITIAGYKEKLKEMRPSILQYLSTMEHFNSYISHSLTTEDFDRTIYLPQIGFYYFENYMQQQSFIDKCLIVTSYLRNLSLDSQLVFVFTKLISFRAFSNLNLFTILYIKFMKIHMLHLPSP